MKKIGLILLILLLFFTCASVAASDVNETVTASDDQIIADDTNEVLAVDEQESDENIVSFTQEEIIKETDNGTFKALQQKINNADDNSVITLNNDYIYEEGFSTGGIGVHKSLTIDGQGHIIDANSQAKVFDLRESNIIIKNLTFKNCYFNNKGGAISIYGDNCNVSSCYFNNCSSNIGGAIYIYYRVNCSINSCYFSECYSSSGGGAIYTSSNNYCNISSSTFNNCSSSSSGGAIYTSSNFCNISSSAFNNCSSSSSGGAIYTSSDFCDISSSNFTKCLANDYGNAIYNYKYDKCISTNCNFTEMVESDTCYDVILINCTIKNININIVSIKDSNYYQEGNFTFKLIDMDTNETVANKSVTITMTQNGTSIYFITKTPKGYNLGTSFTLTSDENGIVTLNNSGFYPGLYIADIVYAPVGIYEVTIIGTGCLRGTNKTNITINPCDVNFALEEFNEDYGTEKNITITVTNAKTGKKVSAVYILLNIAGVTLSEPNQITDANGTIQLGVSSLPAGTYPIIFETNDSNLNYNKNNGTITINPINSSINESEIIFGYGNYTVTLELEGASTFTANLNKTGDYFYIENDTITFFNLDAGEYSLSITTIPDENHLVITKTIKVIVNKVNSSINSSDIEFDYGLYSSVKVDLDGASGFSANVINHTEAIVEIVGDEIFISALNVGYYYLNITTIPDNNHNPTTIISKITVNKVNASITIPTIEFSYGGSTTISPVIDGIASINVFVSNHKEAYIDISTDNKITISGLGVGKYILVVNTLPDDNHNPISTVNASVIVNKANTLLTSSDISNVYGTSNNIIVNLKDINGNLLVGNTIKVTLNNVNYYGKINSNGKVVISVPTNLSPKSYTATITFEGNENYVKSTTTVKVIVKKATPKITAKAKTFKKKVKTKKYKITLKNNLNKVLKNTKVTIKVNKKTYTAKTNAKGVATFKIKKLTKKGTFKSTITYKGNSYYNKVTKKVKIKIK